MAKLASRFDATAHDTEQRDYEELPNGDYELEIEASEVKEGVDRFCEEQAHNPADERATENADERCEEEDGCDCYKASYGFFH